MKTAMKKALSALLAVVIIATAIPFTAFAADENVQGNQTVSTDMGDMSLTATNSFGEMLSESLTELTDEQDNGYYISDVEYQGDCALVTFATKQNCTICVAAYEEDTGRMITSAMSDVLAADTEVIVEFEDELPDYFVLKAFMLDDNSAALCKAYTCNEETQMYEDFVETTVEDYPEDKVINLDESVDNNFLVMSDDTTTVTADGAKNALVSYNSETGVYTFSNIDEQVKSLNIGDIFYFDNGDVEELTFIKVGSINISGTTAYITEAETSIEEVFDTVKINNDMTSGEFDVDEAEELEDGITYDGVTEIEESEEFSTFAWESEKSITFQHDYTLDKTIKPKEPKKIGKLASLTGSIKIEGSAGFSVTGTFKYYISRKFSEVEFTLTPKVSVNVSVEGVGRFEVKLKSLDYSPCPGVYVGISPKFIVEASVEASFNTTLKFTLGFGYNTNDGLVNKTKKPTFKPEFKIEGKIFIGVDLGPHAYVISKKAAMIELGSEIGAQLTATLSTDNGENHLCNSCLDGDIDLVGDLTGKLVFGETTKWEKKVTITFLSIKIDIVSFYYSYTHEEFGWGECPYSAESDGNGGNNGNGDNNEVGDLIEFGSYPQTKVTDTSLLSALNSLSLSWASYGYYSGTGSTADGQMQPGDYMKYADVTYKGERYRAVKFTEYRPYYTGYQPSANNTYQDDNGYYTNTVYWFKFEPLKWRVLDPDEGFMVCESIIDSQPYNNTSYWKNGNFWQDTSCTTYDNDYATSSIRDWLNDDFYHTAFTAAEKAQIQKSAQDNSCYDPNYPQYDSATTNDKIFLLSWDEVTNSEYGFNSSSGAYDTARRAQGTDYAKAQGLYVYNSTVSEYPCNSWWWLRSPYDSSHYACGVHDGGYCSDFSTVDRTYNGVRPALKFNPTSGIFESYAEQFETVSIEGEVKADLTKYLTSKKSCIENEEYVLMVLKSGTEIFELSEEDLLYIDQKTAESDEVSFTYVPKTDVEADVYIIGMSSSGEIVQEIITVSDIQSVTYTQQEDTHKNFTVTTNGRKTMIQFIEPDGGTRTYDRYNKNVSITSYNSDGEVVNAMARDLAYEVWEIHSNMSVGNEIKVRGKENGKWDAEKYSFVIEQYNPVISMELSSTSGKKGPVLATVVADEKTEKVMFKMPNGTSVTVAPSGKDENGNNIFTGKAWMNEDGVNIINVFIRRDNVWKSVGTLEYTVE